MRGWLSRTSEFKIGFHAGKQCHEFWHVRGCCPRLWQWGAKLDDCLSLGGPSEIISGSYAEILPLESEKLLVFVPQVFKVSRNEADVSAQLAFLGVGGDGGLQSCGIGGVGCDMSRIKGHAEDGACNDCVDDHSAAGHFDPAKILLVLLIGVGMGGIYAAFYGLNRERYFIIVMGTLTASLAAVCAVIVFLSHL